MDRHQVGVGQPGEQPHLRALPLRCARVDGEVEQLHRHVPLQQLVARPEHPRDAAGAQQVAEQVAVGQHRRVGGHPAGIPLRDAHDTQGARGNAGGHHRMARCDHGCGPGMPG